MSARYSPAYALLALAGFLLSTVAQGAAPPTKRPTDEARGKELYDRHCGACHGAWAKGHGPATQALVRPVPDLQGKVEATDPMITVVMRGRGAMPGYEQTFDRFDAKRVLQHMAKLEVPPEAKVTPPKEPAEEPPAPAAE